MFKIVFRTLKFDCKQDPVPSRILSLWIRSRLRVSNFRLHLAMIFTGVVVMKLANATFTSTVPKLQIVLTGSSIQCALLRCNVASQSYID